MGAEKNSKKPMFSPLKAKKYAEESEPGNDSRLSAVFNVIRSTISAFFTRT
ncbi:MAG: hypothetical protein ACLFN5_06910 [bacterium]